MANDDRRGPTSVPEVLSEARLRAARRRWRAAGFAHDAVRARLGVADHRQNRTPRLADRLGAVAAARLGAPPVDALDAMIDLLVLNNPVRVDHAARRLGPEGLADLVDLRLARVEEGEVHADLTLSEWGGLFFASDTMWRTRGRDGRFGAGRMPDDTVLNPIFDSFEFASTLTRRTAARALDLCTGCGVVALHASRTHDEVVAVDNQERSVRFARFNAALNERGNVEVRRGDLYQGLGDGRFDTISANPPYMPTADATPGENFYCGGPRGDVLTRAVLDGLDAHLAVGGYAHLVGFLIGDTAEISAATTSPDLGARSLAGYDVVRYTYEVPRADPSVVSAIAAFGAAARVEYGAYALRRRGGSAEAGWFLRAPCGPPVLDIDDLLAGLGREGGAPESWEARGVVRETVASRD